MLGEVCHLHLPEVRSQADAPYAQLAKTTQPNRDSAVFHALAAPATYWFWADQWSSVEQAQPLNWWLWLAVIGYVAVPFLSGTVVGRGIRAHQPWATWFTGPNPAPRAWDHVFGSSTNGWVRMRMKSDAWLGGAYAAVLDRRSSYAAGYPDPQDLFLAVAAELDQSTGAFMRDDNDDLILLEGGILVRWEEVEYLEFIEDERRDDRGDKAHQIH